MKSQMFCKIICSAIILFEVIAVCVNGECNTYCKGCDSFIRAISCNANSAPNLKDIIADVPIDAYSLHIDGGMFHSVMDTTFADKPLKNLNELRITNSQLQEISSSAFAQLTSLQKLELTNNRISLIQPSAFNGLRNLINLDLSNNAIQQLSSEELFSSMYYLKTLDLSNNQLSDFLSGIFSSQANLQDLYIANNVNYVNLRGISFSGLTNLRRFYAGGCRIQTLEADFFRVLNSIHTLDLSHNQIRSLPNIDSLGLLRNLRNLTLMGNQIEALVDGQFPGLDLDVLDLSANSISSISPNVFMYMKRATHLDLSKNKIHSLPSYIFQPISSEINSLRLNDNPALINLPTNIFNGMLKMHELNLSSCAIKSLDEQFFQQLFLYKIDISNNWLQFLPQSFIDKANLMQQIKLANNPWHCDCNIRPLQTWLQSTRPSTTLHCTDFTPMGFDPTCEKPKCSTPASLANKEIASLSYSELEPCEKLSESTSSPVTIIIGVVVGLVVVALIIIIIACCLYRRHKRGQPLLCFEHPDYSGRTDRKPKRRPHPQQKPVPEKHEYEAVKQKFRKEPKGRKDYYVEKKEKRRIDADSASLNESDKSFIVRNFFSSMAEDPEGDSEGTQSMTRKDSQESLSQSGIGYGSRRGSRCSSQYSLDRGLNIESAV